MKVIGLDPGPARSALVVLDAAQVTHTWQLDNEALLMQLGGLDLQATLVVEKIEAMGMAVGAEVFETVFWSGRFCEAWQSFGSKWDRVSRRQVKLHLCGNMRAKDANVRMALIDKFGPGKEIAIGKKAKPGPLYRVSSHCWAALACAVVWAETEKKPSESSVSEVPN